MKNLLKKLFFKFFHPLALRLGYVNKSSVNLNNVQTDFLNKRILLHTFYAVIKAAAFNPKHIVDVGANHGTWTREALMCFPDSLYTLIEPQAHLKESIKDLLIKNPNIHFYAVGAGKKAGVYDFTIRKEDHSCTFMYSKQEALENNLKQVQLPIVTLNELISKNNLPVPDIIKIDAEGIDIDVLEGSNNFFGKTEVFMVEAGIVNKNFSNSFLRVINYMDQNNYRLFDITDMNRPFNPPVLWLTELVFVKKDGIIDTYKWI